MNPKHELDMDKIAEALGAERRGVVRSTGGYFGAMQLVAEVHARFRAPAGGGRTTDPNWTERRLLPLAPKTLDRLEHLSRLLKDQAVSVTPLQVAALLLESAIDATDEEAVADLARERAS